MSAKTTISSTLLSASRDDASTITGTFSASSALAGAVTRTRWSNTTAPPPRMTARMSSHITDLNGS